MKTRSIQNLKKRAAGTHGFTLAEMLIVVAIIAILSGVAFVSVQTYRRSLAQLERDNIAKQFFIAAQNHLSATQMEAVPNADAYGTKGNYDDDDDKKVYYYVVTRGAVSEKGTDAFDRMLPYGAIDETVRAGGSYLIRYQPEAGIVMDVFYCSTSGTPNTFNHSISTSEYATLMGLTGAGNKAARRTFTAGGNSVLGWYGGAEAEVKTPLELKPPRIEVINAETLRVVVTDDPDNQKTAYLGKYSLKLIVTGNTSGAKKSFLLLKSANSTETEDQTGRVSGTYTVVLDDITAGGKHFSDLVSEVEGKTFIPGENITVQAMAYSTEEFSNIAYSPRRTTNSLFSGISDALGGASGGSDGIPDTASISNFRHLENLDKIVSNLDANDTSNKLNISAAVQIANLNWKTDDGAYWPSKTVVPSNGKTMAAGYSSQYYPVSPDYALSYDGKSHSITGVTASAANAGLFGAVSVNGSEIKNLELIDFTVTGTTNAGALAGSAANTAVTNVLARNTGKTGIAADITSAAGSAGGLIGSATGGSVTDCAAALIVNGGANAGGLIGTAGGTVTGCYAGGHTVNGAYDKEHYNVTATGTAGGLIGSFTGTGIEKCYSTCSVKGGTAGGLVGSASGTITNCYCTGLVSGTTEGAFAGSLSGTAQSCRYFEIINEREKKNGAAHAGYDYLTPLPNAGTAGGITAFDETTASYNGFVGAPSAWTSAKPYDTALVRYYGGRYDLQSVVRLGETTTGFAATHYGDWPAPEIFTINS